MWLKGFPLACYGSSERKSVSSLSLDHDSALRGQLRIVSASQCDVNYQIYLKFFMWNKRVFTKKNPQNAHIVLSENFDG
ncbi:hypothetical protein TNCV_3741611 [Trichonephila clavipes]|nr:hypothetical protein TNCV_3741611 [Trichonephila clavipes]